ncbi:MAG TPA: hypothetical protein VFX60_19180 [Micromonospora sp.]|nr:hypothetical protein [Micromonospora sp.]
MNGWIILLGYILGAVLSWRSLTVSLLMDLEEVGTLNSGDRATAAVFGTMCAAVWPVSLPARAGWRVLKRTAVLQTPKEKLAAQERELRELRRQAREYGLPMPSEQDMRTTETSPSSGVGRD